MSEESDIVNGLISRLRGDDQAMQDLFAFVEGGGRTASTQSLSGLRLLNHLSKVYAGSSEEAPDLFDAVVRLAFENPEIRSELLPILMNHASRGTS